MAAGILIGSAGSGSGKTLVTCALLAILTEDGKRVQAVKCGPDYIDPMFHREVLSVPSRNLDTFFTGERLTRALYREAAQGADLIVAEGAMGIYDGLGGVRREGSAYHLAEVTGMPVLLVVDAHGMGRSVLALIRGFLDYDRSGRIAGVLLNRMSESSYRLLAPKIERELGLSVIGYLPRLPEAELPDRHLGLVLPWEIEGLRAKIRATADVMRRTADIGRLLAIAERARTRDETFVLPEAELLTACPSVLLRGEGRLRIGVARDEAFCFYYEENLALLRRAGAELVPFSPLRDRALPEGICGLLLGGGYPELYAERLSRNVSLREQIAGRISDGLPTVAECGGFLYLHEVLEDPERREYPMVGVVPGRCFDTGRSVRFGYVELVEKQEGFLPRGERILGHEFHHYDSTSNGEDVAAVKPVSGRRYDCVHRGSACWLGFPHLYWYSNPAFAFRFLEMAARYHRTRI